MAFSAKPPFVGGLNADPSLWQGDRLIMRMHRQALVHQFLAASLVTDVGIHL